MFVDSHAHLEGPKFDSDRADVLARARAAGVEAILCIGNGTGPGTLDCAARLAEQHGGIYASTGVHPHEARLADADSYAEIERLIAARKVIAVGEIGLDYFYKHSEPEVQQQVFVRQMEIARAAKLPIILHIRPATDNNAAWEDAFRLLREHWQPTGLGGIFHCFTGNAEQAQRALDLGFLISFAGVVTFPKSADIQAAARAVSLDRMLIETDSPFLAPAPHRGQRNEPAYVVETARYLAQLRDRTPDEIGTATTRNFRGLFKI
ncbi:MAG: TatD family hydrolase [Candidatus Koribacter versatilis]|uniref:TatD family hydrolase n=1 Tax=Candidatus Korobacter versatilis TaxID=658062 RepID=A0A932ENE5_9BACT|nr:TatD family hydrolase [Candidatus Koribacter versatilis]